MAEELLILGILKFMGHTHEIMSTDYGVTCFSILTSNGSGREVADAVIRYIEMGAKFTLINHPEDTKYNFQARSFLSNLEEYEINKEDN